MKPTYKEHSVVQVKNLEAKGAEDPAVISRVRVQVECDLAEGLALMGKLDGTPDAAMSDVESHIPKPPPEAPAPKKGKSE